MRTIVHERFGVCVFAGIIGNMREDDDTPLWLRAVPYVLFIAALVMLVARSFYSFCWIDESFYLSLADRLYRGGALFIDEWHPAQVYAPLLLPPYALYVSATGGTEGIALYFRLLYVGFSFVVAVFSYVVFKRDFGRFLACCIALMYLFYVRGNILGLSYYALCASFCMIGLVFGWCTYRRMRDVRDDGSPDARRVLMPLCSGICFALAIICNPYVMVLFFLACLTGLIYSVMLGRSKLFIPFAWAIAGAVLVAAVYLMFVFQRSEPGAILDNLQNVLASHDENLTLARRLPNYFSYFPISRVGFVGTWLLVIFLVFWRVSGHGVSRRFRACVILIDTVCLLLACWAAFTTSTYPNKVFLAFAEFALPCFLLQEDVRVSPRIHPELHLFWIPGVLLSLIWQFSSNTQISGMLIGFMFTCMGAFLTVRSAVPTPNEMLPNSINRPAPGWVRALCLVLIAGVVCSTAYVRLADVYSDCAWNEMTTEIPDGPAAGLRTSEQHLQEYEGVRELVARINTSGGVWIEPMSPWAYLECPGACATVSTWNTFMDQHDADEYYAMPGHEWPEWILVTNDDIGDPVNVIAGQVKDFPALDMYHDYNAQLRAHLDEGDEYGVYAEGDYGVLYKRAKHEQISQG